MTSSHYNGRQHTVYAAGVSSHRPPPHKPHDIYTNYACSYEPVQLPPNKNHQAVTKTHGSQRRSIFSHKYAKQFLFGAFAIGFLSGYDHILGSSSYREARIDVMTEEDKSAGQSPHASKQSTLELLGSLSRERSNLWRAFEADFGQYRGLIFDKGLVLQRVFVVSDVSRERLVRRMMIKLLAAQLDPTVTPTFTWATAGDEVAAAHGNMFSQSYTAVMERTAKAAFAAVGIDLVANNHGMGSMGSGPELALCMESVYGTDVDVLSWDFAVAERGLDDRFLLWGNRAGVHRTKPVLFMIDSGSENRGARWNHMLRLELEGLGAVLMDEEGLNRIRLRLPDVTNPHLNQEDIPLPLRNYMCNGTVEGIVACDDEARKFRCDTEEGGACQGEKFRTDEFCRNAEAMPWYQDSWNYGWKEHHLRGKLMGFFLVEMLNEALIELDSLMKKSASISDESTLDGLLDGLKSQEESDRDQFMNAPVASDTDQGVLSDLEPRIIHRSHAVCRTALLPSHASMIAGVRDASESSAAKDGHDTKNGAVPLVFDPWERQACEGLNFDYRDYFLVEEGSEWLTALVPNDAELDAFGGAGTNEGLILVCLRKCFGSEEVCEKAMTVGLDNVSGDEKDVMIEVDANPVVKTRKIENCYFLEGEQGLRWRDGVSGRGQHSLKFHVAFPGGALHISSIIVL